MQNLCSCGKKGGRALAESTGMAEERESLEVLVGRLLHESGQTIACAESCTGGLLTSRLTDVAGSSAYVMGAVVSYTNEVKTALVGAVSEQTAREMAEGVRRRIPADIGVAITGIAGPGGATAEKPVGLVYIAVAAEHMTHCVRHVFDGSRTEVKRQSTEAALAMARDLLTGKT